MKYDYDLIVIGGGAAGLTASGVAASLGAKTALIEAKKLGGDCTWYGCIPSKTLLKSAKLVHHFKGAHRYGLCDTAANFDFAKIMEHVHRTQQRVYQDADAPEIYQRLGVHVIFARATFLDPHTVELSNANATISKLTSRYFMIATGSSPVVPSIEGLSQAGYLTNETIFSLSELPKRLMVLGAGPIGIEMSQAFRRFGSDVMVIDVADRILPNDNRELADLLKTTLESEGIRFFLESQAIKVEKWNDGLRLTLNNKSGSADRELLADALLLSVGRRPTTDGLDLEAAGVNYNKRGVMVDDHCRTSMKNIYAIGDVASRFQFTHFAEHMAKIAVANALLHLPLSLDSKHITWCTYSDPELAHVGYSEAELQEKAISHDVYRFPFSKIDRAITDNETKGWVKVYARRFDGMIYGADILGTNAGEMIGEYALAMRNGITLKRFADTVHPYPTYVLGNRRAADQWYVRKQSRIYIRLLQKIFGYQGQLPDTSDPKRIV